ncbi:MAG: L-2-hydroxyglutarate oxidase [Planctomycetes bacterium]|nr:L-2-hydroxyglutarate oxidase [Planctomycetota bacterium]
MGEAFDIAVVGGGIVGLATAYRLLRAHPDLRLVLLEKEDRPGAHQTGHNSGVIHSGLYYRPGSAKARTCVAGGELVMELCRENGVPFRVCGKVVVATEERELPALEELYRRGTANGVKGLELIGAERLREIEPHATGIRALHVPGAGIIDYAEVARKLAGLVAASGGDVRTGARLTAVRHEERGLVLETTRGSPRARWMVSCAGLHSDRVALLEGGRHASRIVPFRGEYYELVPERCQLVKALIYPVPDPRFPFLGVHFTRTIHGGVEAGPNAVLAFAREGYRKSDVSLRDLAEVLAYPGFWRLAARYWRTGYHEMVRSYSRRAFVAALRRLVPEVREEDVKPAGSGVRAQALARTGQLVDDFLIVERPRALHVLNAPSPAATASLAIAGEILRKAEERFELGPRADVGAGLPAR